MKLTKLMLAVFAVVLTCPAMAQLSSKAQMRLERDLVRAASAVPSAADYVRGLQYYLESKDVGCLDCDAAEREGVYQKMMTLANEELTSLGKLTPEEIDIYALGRLTKMFQEEMDADPSNATVEQYKEFYKRHAENPRALVTIGIWRTHSFQGIFPYRHAWTHFWFEPEQFGRMFSAMAEMDDKVAFLVVLENIKADFDSAYPTFPEGDLKGTAKEYAEEFFTKAAKGHEKFAAAFKVMKEEVQEMLDLHDYK